MCELGIMRCVFVCGWPSLYVSVCEFFLSLSLFDGHIGAVEEEGRCVREELEEERTAAVGGVRLGDELIS